MSQVAFPLTSFTDSTGAPLVNGSAEIRISNDVQSSTGQICAGMKLVVPLNSSGVMTSVPQVWPNASLSPSGSTYILSAYTSEGELAYGPESITI